MKAHSQDKLPTCFKTFSRLLEERLEDLDSDQHEDGDGV